LRFGIWRLDTRASRVKISYFIHDVGHPDLMRRFEMLRVGGAEISVFGFHRKRSPDAEVADAVVDLGRTVDADFAQRIWALVRAIPQLGRWAARLAASELILARNLEMLILAAIVRRRYAPDAALVYECLDIHRMMLSSHVAGKVLRALERVLLHRCQGLMVSSPAFICEYFDRFHPTLPETLVVENKVFGGGDQLEPEAQTADSGPPWRIGWFGVLRCRRSLEVLSHLARSTPQLVEVVVAGMPALNVFPDGGKAFAGIPGLTFLGSYRDEAELSRLFRSVHFAWAVDFYEAGGNSNWLLPNRLYRAALYGTVPVAIATVETGHWLANHGAGILLGERLEEQLVDTMQSMTPQSFAWAKAAIDRIPKSALIVDANECRGLVQSLGKLGRSSGTPRCINRRQPIEAVKAKS
jgi:succinoglycan biosynthesis protein ExoL